MLTSALATGIMAFITTILFLFCTPDLDTLFSLDAPQPFIQIYAMAMGKGPSVFMTVVAVVGLVLVNRIPPLVNPRLTQLRL
jgi:translation initiation factor 5B